MVWAGLSPSGVIGSIFFDGNVNDASLLQMFEIEFYPQFMELNNSLQLIFQQDNATPHWDRPVRDWLNENLPNWWIRRGDPDDQQIP